jgi:hypothetical protein
MKHHVALVLLVTIAAMRTSAAQSLGIGLSTATGRTVPFDRSVLDREIGVGLTLAHRPLAGRSTELHMELGGSSRQLYMAGSVRWSATLSRGWRTMLGPVGVAVLPGVGAQRIETESLVDSGFFALHGRLAGRLDGVLFRGLHAYFEVSTMYAYVLPPGQRTLQRIANPSPPCTNGGCINPFRGALTGSLRGGVMVLLF